MCSSASLKSVIFALSATSALIASGSAARADYITYDFEASYYASDRIKIKADDPLSFTFSILDGVNANARTNTPPSSIGCTATNSASGPCFYDPLTDFLNEATLKIVLKDTAGEEKWELWLDNGLAANGGSFSNYKALGPYDVNTELSSDGLLNIDLLQTLTGNVWYYFQWAELYGTYEKYWCNPQGDPGQNLECQDDGGIGQNEIPEPSALLIFFTGLLGLAALRHHCKSKPSISG